MGLVRNFLSDHRRIAALLLALALAMKALVPAGYMLGEQARVLTVSICADAQGGKFTKQIVIPQSSTHGGSQGDQGKADGSCAYSALSMGSLPGLDSALLVLALAFILAMGFATAPPLRLSQILHLRPPLRGPPAHA